MEPKPPVHDQEVRNENDRVITGHAETIPAIADEIVWVASFLQNDIYHRGNNDPAETVDAATHQYVRLALLLFEATLLTDYQDQAVQG